MSTLFKQFLILLTGTDNFAALSRSTQKTEVHQSEKLSERELIQRESEIGGTLFGPVPIGHHRQFFNLDPMTWVWYEKWTDPITGRDQSTTIRYEIHDNGIMKIQDGLNYQFLESPELDNFVAAISAYYDHVMRDVYSSDPITGQPISTV